jgi:hypothetical protein
MWETIRDTSFINAPWHQVIGMFPDNSVDTVFALDFIEHLEKEDGLQMLREAQRVARRQVVVYTPHGFFPQTYDDPEKEDRWGMDGGYWQTHRSGWDMEDFGDQWEFLICPDYITLDEHNHEMEEPMGALWAIRNLSPVGRTPISCDGRQIRLAYFKQTLERGLPPSTFNGLRSAWGKVLRLKGTTPSQKQESAGKCIGQSSRMNHRLGRSQRRTTALAGASGMKQ